MDSMTKNVFGSQSLVFINMMGLTGYRVKETFSGGLP